MMKVTAHIVASELNEALDDATGGFLSDAGVVDWTGVDVGGNFFFVTTADRPGESVRTFRVTVEEVPQ